MPGHAPDAALQDRVICAEEDGDQGGRPHALWKDLGQEMQRPGGVVAAVPSQHHIRLLQQLLQIARYTRSVKRDRSRRIGLGRIQGKEEDRHLPTVVVGEPGAPSTIIETVLRDAVSKEHELRAHSGAGLPRGSADGLNAARGLQLLLAVRSLEEKELYRDHKQGAA